MLSLNFKKETGKLIEILGYNNFEKREEITLTHIIL